MILRNPKAGRRAICWCDASQPLQACAHRVPAFVRGAFSDGVHPTPGICGSAGETVEQSLQPFPLPLQESGRRICLENPAAPVSLGEQRFDTFCAQDPLKMRNCSVKVLRCIGAHPGACFGCNVHCILSLSHIAFLTHGILHSVGAAQMLLVRCLVRFAKRNEKDTGNRVPHKPGLPHRKPLDTRKRLPIHMM
jgi:hypothetical protein